MKNKFNIGDKVYFVTDEFDFYKGIVDKIESNKKGTILEYNILVKNFNEYNEYWQVENTITDSKDLIYENAIKLIKNKFEEFMKNKETEND